MDNLFLFLFAFILASKYTRGCNKQCRGQESQEVPDLSLESGQARAEAL